ncbi:hypothetical protein BD410DRAFT_440183 [Rickenella mellea]|uniref:Uncharacterized protein n=1 Tax=Rickenella mellea TaxID=50990 RepID=A0A4Y7PW84_9AGAM|nr:hypothetical protein BD410DRAFT_440183 [Rickenella mellea]
MLSQFSGRCQFASMQSSSAPPLFVPLSKQTVLYMLSALLSRKFRQLTRWSPFHVEIRQSTAHDGLVTNSTVVILFLNYQNFTPVPLPRMALWITFLENVAVIPPTLRFSFWEMALCTTGSLSQPRNKFVQLRVQCNTKRNHCPEDLEPRYSLSQRTRNGGLLCWTWFSPFH